MGIGYLLGGVACLRYAVLVGYFGGIKNHREYLDWLR